MLLPMAVRRGSRRSLSDKLHRNLDCPWAARRVRTGLSLVESIQIFAAQKLLSSAAADGRPWAIPDPQGAATLTWIQCSPIEFKERFSCLLVFEYDENTIFSGAKFFYKARADLPTPLSATLPPFPNTAQHSITNALSINRHPRPTAPKL